MVGVIFFFFVSETHQHARSAFWLLLFFGASKLHFGAPSDDDTQLQHFFSLSER